MPPRHLKACCASSLALACALFWAAIAPAHAEPRVPAPPPSGDVLRVQLQWTHQAQFAGFYVAQARKHFEAAGLHVVLQEGGPGRNPIVELQEGRADIAVSWLGNAWALSTRQRPVTNVAQIFSGSSLAIVCRVSAGVYGPKDLQGRQVGVWHLGDQHLVQELLRRLQIPPRSVQLVAQAGDAQDLVAGRLPCVTAMTYNEYWKILRAGVPASDLVLIDPEHYGIPHIEDGLYVASGRLTSPQFQDQLSRFVRALHQGWTDARNSPTLALDTVHRISGRNDHDMQRHMLETVLTKVTHDRSFGLFDLQRYRTATDILMSYERRPHELDTIWSHAVWNQVRQKAAFTTATLHYAREVSESAGFRRVLLAGIYAYALATALMAIEAGYGLWTRLVLAMTAPLGGSAIRDLLIGESRMPFFFMKHWEFPVGICAVVVLVSLLFNPYRRFFELPTVRLALRRVNTVGFSLVAVNGALVAIIAQLPWYWVPACAAISCTGGGMLKDVLLNREPASFQGALVEEVAVVTGFCIVIGMWIANLYEHTPVPVYASLALGFALCVSVVEWLHRSKPRLPLWMGGVPRPASAQAGH